MLPTRTPPLAIALGFALALAAGKAANVLISLSSGGPAAEAVGSLSVGAVGSADPRPDAGASAYMDARSRTDGPTPSAPDRLSSGGPAANAVGLLSVGAPAAPVGIPDAGADSAGSILTSPAVGAPSAASPTSPDLLLSALISVESGGDPRAVGDGGRAVGILQIWPITVRDANRILGRDEFTLADRLDPERSARMFEVYQSHYNPTGDPERGARIWNGGPDGWKQDSTLDYWRRVKAAMEEQP